MSLMASSIYWGSVLKAETVLPISLATPIFYIIYAEVFRFCFSIKPLKAVGVLILAVIIAVATWMCVSTIITDNSVEVTNSWAIQYVSAFMVDNFIMQVIVVIIKYIKSI